MMQDPYKDSIPSVLPNLHFTDVETQAQTFLKKYSNTHRNRFQRVFSTLVLE